MADLRAGALRRMTTANELRAGLLAVAKRSVSIMTACTNKESTKLYLVLPFLGLLGYDYANPYEVYPEHAASPDCKVDFAILSDGNPVIAIEVQKSGTDLAEGHEKLARYFAAVPEARLAILTNGTLFEFYVDAENPNTMDHAPFLTVDLETTEITAPIKTAKIPIRKTLLITPPNPQKPLVLFFSNRAFDYDGLSRLLGCKRSLIIEPCFWCQKDEAHDHNAQNVPLP